MIRMVCMTFASSTMFLLTKLDDNDDADAIAYYSRCYCCCFSWL